MSFASVNDITAKLEKLEQNITLTLQEIDHNFSACQYKVTTKILPQITRFACVSEDIWENSKVSFQLYYIYIYFFFFQKKHIQFNYKLFCGWELVIVVIFRAFRFNCK